MFHVRNFLLCFKTAIKSVNLKPAKPKHQEQGWSYVHTRAVNTACYIFLIFSLSEMDREQNTSALRTKVVINGKIVCPLSNCPKGRVDANKNGRN